LRAPSLGLGPNWRQFALLVAVNAFVGGMVGLERSVLPLLARDEFGVSSATAAVSFVATFGVAKALTNLFAGHLSERFGRRNLLILGWLLGLPVPFVIILAPSWGWVIAANLLLGLNQGLAWSMTVNMKMDLAGPERRGLALGLNEAAGYLAVAGAAFLSGIIADSYGLRPEPFYLGIGFASCGLALSVLLVRDTKEFVALEGGHREEPARGFLDGLADSSWRDRRLFGLNQAGFVNNLNDALAWGIFPLYFASRGLSLDRIAILAGLYPLLWGVLQLFTGWLSDVAGRKPLIVSGMLAQGAAISLVALTGEFGGWLAAVSLLGVGTAMVYPTLLAAIGDTVHPARRASLVGVYRFWRDGGAAVGAITAGVIADAFGFKTAIQCVAILTVMSGVVAFRAIGGPARREAAAALDPAPARR
jgi:MFS family permease